MTRSAVILGAGLLLAVGLAGGPRSVRADDGHAQGDRRAAQPSHPADDADLMEFLGGIGSENEEWIDYLARTDPTKVAAAPKRPAADGKAPRTDPPDGSQQK